MMAMEFCGREYNFPTHFGEVADTCGDLNIACPSCLLAHIAKLEAHIAQLDERVSTLLFTNGVLDSAAKDTQAWSVRAQTAEAKCAQLEAHKAESMQVFAALQIQEIAKEIGAPLGSGVAEHILPWIKSAKVQLEAQRGELARELDLTKREAWTAKERHKDEKDRADGLRERLDELNAEDFAKAQRGGAVVVPPELVESDLDALAESVDAYWDDEESDEIAKSAYALAVSRIQPIPADRVLADGMVGVDRDLLTLLDKALESCKYAPQHVLREAIQHAIRAQQAKGE